MELDPKCLSVNATRSRLVALVCVFTNSLFRLWFFLGEKQNFIL